MGLFKKIGSNYMISEIKNLKGNARACVYTEPLWFIPYNMFMPFATIYMYKLGLDDIQIGSLVTIGLIFQVIASFFGGAMTDKLGRRLTCYIADTVSWSIPCFIWAFAQNFWWFLIASVLHSTIQIATISWSSLLVEDCEKKSLVTVYSAIQMCGLIAAFIAPVSILFFSEFDVVHVVRGLYIFTGICMSLKFYLLYKYSNETVQGEKRIEETKGVPFYKLLVGYKDVIQKVLHSRPMKLTLLILLGYNIMKVITETYFGLYTTENLHISESFLTIFPMVRAVIMLTFILVLHEKLNKLPYRPVMISGFLLYALGMVALILTPNKSLGFVFLYTFLEGIAVACIEPRKEALTVLMIDEQERSRVCAVLYMVMVGITAPFGIITGALSKIDRRLPFCLSIIIAVILLVTVLISKEIRRIQKRAAINE